MRRRIDLFTVINVIILLAVVLVTLYPFVHMAAVSLSKDIYVMKNEVTWYPKGFTMDMYKIVLKDPRILQGYVNTIIYVVLGTLIALVVTALGAYSLAKKEMLFHRGFTLLIVITMFFSGGMIPTFLI